jgi:hypothetical protein
MSGYATNRDLAWNFKKSALRSCLAPVKTLLRSVKAMRSEISIGTIEISYFNRDRPDIRKSDTAKRTAAMSKMRAQPNAPAKTTYRRIAVGP